MHQGIRARDQLHQYLEEAIAEKLHEDTVAEPGDALNLIIHSARELGHELSVQELKVGGWRLFLPLFVPSRCLHTLAPFWGTGTYQGERKEETGLPS